MSTDPIQGEAFFGLGTIDLRKVVPGLKAGQAYNVEIRLSNSQFVARGSPFTCRGGIRFGAMRQVGEEDAIRDAVALAKESDGEYYELCIQLLFTVVVATILVIGLNHDWESEGFDRKHME